MKVIAFGGYAWEDDGFWFGVKEDVTLVPSVEPQVLLRPGAYATFGVSSVGAMNITGQFGFFRNSLASSLGIEGAFQYLFKRLNPVLATPRELRTERNDGAIVTIPAILALPNFSSDRSVDIKDATFVCVQPYFDGIVVVTASGSFG